MSLFIILIICMLIFFTILFFLFMHYVSIKNDDYEEKLYIKVIVSFIFSIIITVVFLFFIGIVFGSTFLTNLFFHFHIDWKIILYISLLIIIYSFLFDHIFVNVIQLTFGKSHLFFILISFIRLFIFFVLIQIFSISIRKSIVFSLVIPLILFLNVFLVLNREEKKKCK